MLPVAPAIEPPDQITSSLVTITNPTVIAQLDAKNMRTWGNFKMTNEAGYEKVFTWCQDSTATAEIAVALDAFKYLGYRWNRKTKSFSPLLDLARDVKVTVLAAPKHGTVAVAQSVPTIWNYSVAQTTEDGTSAFTGKDHVVFEIVVKDKRFKAVVNLNVAPGVDERSGSACERMKFSSQAVQPNGMPVY